MRGNSIRSLMAPVAVSPASIGNEGCDVPEERAIFQERDSASQQQFVIDPQ